MVVYGYSFLERKNMGWFNLERELLILDCLISRKEKEITSIIIKINSLINVNKEQVEAYLEILATTKESMKKFKKIKEQKQLERNNI